MLLKTDRSTPHAKPDRVSFERPLAYAILDEALVCHVAFVDGNAPVVIPTTHWRVGDHLYFHGGHGSRLIRLLAGGAPVSVSVTLVDGIVLARSAFHHSMNYRSLVLFGQAREITEADLKTEAFEVLVDKLSPGRSGLVRRPSPRELAATRLVAMEISEGSVKMRSGPPVEAPEDLDLPVWAGVWPTSLTLGTPMADAHVPPDLTIGLPSSGS